MVSQDFSQENVDALLNQDRDFLWHHLTQHQVFQASEPMVMVEGRGLIVKDIRGREYIDATSGGVWCVNVGYGRDSIADAVCAQLKKLPFYTSTAGNIPAIQFAGKLMSLLPKMGKAFFSNSGSEANEKAYKIVRQYGCLKYQDKLKHKILYRNRDYHGTTLAALASSGQEERKDGYGPLPDGFVEFPHACCYRCAFDKKYPGCSIECALAVESIIQRESPDTVAAIIVEPITAGGGIIVPVYEYYPLLQEICRKYEVLLIMDEVVCGFGRTGKMFGHEHYEVDPDILTIAKGVTSAYMPLSATVVKNEIFEIFVNDPADKMAYFRDISTYAGCSGAYAAALESLKIVEEERLCENSRVVGDYLLGSLEELRHFSIVGDVRGRGLFAGIEFVEDRTTKQPVSEAFLLRIIKTIADHGVLVGRTNRSIPGLNNTINLAPALVAKKEDIDRIVLAISKAITAVTS